MAVASKKILCPSCGFSNTAPLANNRCVSCGAKIEDLKRALTLQEELERRYQQEGFSLPWFGVSIGIITVMTAALVMGLPMVVPLFDFEGSAGMTVAITTSTATPIDTAIRVATAKAPTRPRHLPYPIVVSFPAASPVDAWDIAHSEGSAS